MMSLRMENRLKVVSKNSKTDFVFLGHQKLRLNNESKLLARKPTFIIILHSFFIRTILSEHDPHIKQKVKNKLRTETS